MYTKQQVKDLFEKVYKDKNLLIFGEEMDGFPEMVTEVLERFSRLNGKFPGILGLDIRMANLVKLGEEGVERVVKELTDYAERGGLVTCSAHFSNPKNKHPEVWDCRGSIGLDDVWLEMITEGTELNKYFKIELSAIADFFEKLKNNNVPVIWRPLHETNGNWFWFCMVQKNPETGENAAIKEETFVATWKYIYDYFTYERKLDNLLWEFSPNMVPDNHEFMVPALYGYPGDMCDFVGFDWYTRGNYEVSLNSTYKDLASTGKPVAIAEWGPSGEIKADPALGQKQEDLFTGEDLLALVRRMSADGYSATYMLTWTLPWTLGALTRGKVFMNAEGILGLDDVAKMFEDMEK